MNMCLHVEYDGKRMENSTLMHFPTLDSKLCLRACLNMFKPCDLLDLHCTSCPPHAHKISSWIELKIVKSRSHLQVAISFIRSQKAQKMTPSACVSSRQYTYMFTCSTNSLPLQNQTIIHFPSEKVISSHILSQHSSNPTSKLIIQYTWGWGTRV